jgi:radical SAM superfamily enzyme YgiQ (UPF0313 family)
MKNNDFAQKNLIYLVNLKPSSHRTAEESLGVEYLAAALTEKHYNVKILDNWLDNSLSNKDVLKTIIADKEKVLFVGTSSYMLSNEPTLGLIKKLNSEKIATVAGGYGPTFEPEKFLDAGTGFACIGEGEKTIVDIADYFRNGKKDKNLIKGVAFCDNGRIQYTEKQDQIVDLDSVPYPQRPYINLLNERKSTVNVSSSRGCMGKCSFCSIAAFGRRQNGYKWRGRTIPNIVGELKHLQDSGVSAVKFVDDSFIEQERDNLWTANFADAIHANDIDLQLRASIRADKVNMDNMKNLKDAGFISFSCGIENGSQTALRRMGKLASIRDNHYAIDCFRKNGYYVQAGFILFDDKTTMQELKENHAFLSENIDLVSKGIFSEMFAAEGTAFTDRLKLGDSETLASNRLYQVQDMNARKVYDHLKRWQAQHSKIYDKVIDPISAPKAIPVSNMRKYHELMMLMKKVDLRYMKDLISEVEGNGDIESLFNEYTQKFTPLFENCKTSVDDYYISDGLQYDADINQFVIMGNIQKEKENE